MSSLPDLSLQTIGSAFSSGSTTPANLALTLLRTAKSSETVFINTASVEDVQQRCRSLEVQPLTARGPLWGVPFAVKDNIDVAGYPTTCACPDFAYTPTENAPAVEALLQAGAVFIGKTNMDQFACGLVGTRSPHGIPQNAFDSRFIPGGSSSGSAVAVANSIVCFALGTDTAGSGRVPAGLNGVVGIKPTVGRISTKGVVPACYSLDCVSVFACTVADGHKIATVMENHDVADATYRAADPVAITRTYTPHAPFKFAVPTEEYIDFLGPGGTETQTAMKLQFSTAIERLQSMGGQLVRLDFAPFADTAAMLYGAPLVAERYAGIKRFLESSVKPPPGRCVDITPDARLLKVIRAIISRTSLYTAADVYKGLQELTDLQARSRVELSKIDVLVVPTAAYNYTLQEIEAEEEVPSLQDMLGALPLKNANLGRFTNFVNLLNMCGVSVYSGVMELNNKTLAVEGPQLQRCTYLQDTGCLDIAVPFGITILATAWSDAYVASIAAAYADATGLKSGPVGHGVTPYRC